MRIRRTPSSKEACASALVLGSTTGAIDLRPAPGPFALCAHPADRKTRRHRDTKTGTSLRASVPSCLFFRLLITADLLDAVEGDARLAGDGRQALLGFLGVFVLGEAGQRLTDRPGVLVVVADGQALR